MKNQPIKFIISKARRLGLLLSHHQAKSIQSGKLSLDTLLSLSL